ncbi:MAG: MBL fold metallo-hydrolase [Chloroflexi bacterium]|nr:MBL fold metallo-hydrolase [Chloroflexota bacterium]
MTIRMEEVARDIYQLDCGEVPLFLMPQIAYLVAGDMPVLIEPGSTAAAARLLDDSPRLGIDMQKLAYIIPTHIHVDHGGGSGYLVQRLTRPKVVLNPRGATHMMEPSRLIQGTRMAFGDDFEAGFGPILPIPRERILVAAEGQVLRLGKRDLTILFTPGHAVHHISVMDSLTGGLFCGEALGFPSQFVPDMVFPGGIPPFDPETYLKTIERLETLAPGLLFYSHRGARRNTDNHLIRMVKEVTSDFNRIARDAVAAGEDDAQIVERIREYVKQKAPQAELPARLDFDPSGYIDYYRRQR